jgi:murein DD-endopeptidase MepM/ murein hydrolase activator NlpD
MTQDQLAAFMLAAVSTFGTSGAPPVELVHPGPPARAVTSAPARAATLDRIDPVPGARGDRPSPATRWAWPLTPRPHVERLFVRPAGQWGPGHRGIDLAARPGQVVTAVADGTVTHVGIIAGRGTVSVTHPSGLRSTYEPIAGTVARGDAVRRGDPLGTVHGESHCGASCLHVGALRGRTYVDPLPLFRGGPVILLPLR